MKKLLNRFCAQGIIMEGFLLIIIGCGPKWTESARDGIMIVNNQDGQTPGYSNQSGVQILTVDRYGFKDLNKNGKLDAYEDWRLSVQERAEDLASQMSVEQIAGLMLYSAHQRIPGGGFRGGTTYGGRSYDESGAKASDLSDQQVEFLIDDNFVMC
jgi:beta-glucosidase